VNGQQTISYKTLTKKLGAINVEMLLMIKIKDLIYHKRGLNWTTIDKTVMRGKLVVVNTCGIQEWWVQWRCQKINHGNKLIIANVIGNT